MKKVIEKEIRRQRRKRHIRKKIVGSVERPRMSVFKSNKHLYIQVINDETGNTVASVSTVEKGIDSSLKRNVEGAEKLGEMIGKRLMEKEVKTVIFDRNGYRYHGVVKAVAEGARKAGLEF